MVHVGIAVIQHHLDAALDHAVNIAAGIMALVVVADHAHGHATLMGRDDGGADVIVGDGEHADIDLFATGLEMPDHGIATVIAGAEPDPGIDRHLGRRLIHHLDHFAQPFDQLRHQHRLGRIATALQHQIETVVAQLPQLFDAQRPLVQRRGQCALLGRAQHRIGDAPFQLVEQRLHGDSDRTSGA